MSTLAQIRTAVRDEISEPTPGFWTNAEIDRWVNRANLDLTTAAGITSSASASITTASGTESYTLPTDFGLIEQVELVDTADATSFFVLTALPIEDREAAKGSPDGYYVRNGKLYLAPMPDGVYTIRVWYYRAGTVLSADGDTPIIPTVYHDLITLFAVSQCKRKADDPAYTTYLSDYVNGRGGMIEDLRKKGLGNRFSMVVDTDER